MKASSRAFCSAAETKRVTVVSPKNNLRFVVSLIWGCALPFYGIASPFKEKTGQKFSF